MKSFSTQTSCAGINFGVDSVLSVTVLSGLNNSAASFADVTLSTAGIRSTHLINLSGGRTNKTAPVQSLLKI